MTIIDKEPVNNRMVTRIKNLLYTPEAEWTVIEAEPATVSGLYKTYVCILAAIGPVAQLVGSQIFGSHMFFVFYRPPFLQAVVQAIISYLLSLAGVWLMAMIIDALAPSFGGTKNRLQAFKLAAYFPTAAWIAAVFQLVPQVAALSIIGVYSLYLLYVGLPKLMNAPKDKALVYTIVTIVCAVVVFAVINAVSSSVGMGGGVY